MRRSQTIRQRVAIVLRDAAKIALVPMDVSEIATMATDSDVDDLDAEDDDDAEASLKEKRKSHSLLFCFIFIVAAFVNHLVDFIELGLWVIKLNKDCLSANFISAEMIGMKANHKESG